MNILVRAGSILFLLTLGLVACDRFKSDSGPASSATPQSTSIGATTAAAAPAGELKVGDRISVRWKGQCYPARVLKVAGGGTYFITYEGYDHSWDETINSLRICR